MFYAIITNVDQSNNYSRIIVNQGNSELDSKLSVTGCGHLENCVWPQNVTDDF